MTAVQEKKGGRSTTTYYHLTNIIKSIIYEKIYFYLIIYQVMATEGLSAQVDVVINFLHIVEVFKMIDEFGNRLRLCRGDSDKVFGQVS